MTDRAWRVFASDFLRWRTGRQKSGYEKMLLAINPFVIPWDCYLLRFREGAAIPPHTDAVDGRCHYRLNIVLKEARRGGVFECADPIFASRRIKLFRPDQVEHSVSPVVSGTRYVFSVGWVVKP